MFLYCSSNTKNRERIQTSDAVLHHPVIGVARAVVQAVNVKKRLLESQPFVLIGGSGAVRALPEALEKYGAMRVIFVLEIVSSFFRHPMNDFPISAYLLVYSLEEKLEFEVLDLNGCFRPGLIGRASFPLSLLEDDPRRTGEERPITTEIHKAKGTILFDILYYPTFVYKGIASSSGIFSFSTFYLLYVLYTLVAGRAFSTTRCRCCYSANTHGQRYQMGRARKEA